MNNFLINRTSKIKNSAFTKLLLQILVVFIIWKLLLMVVGYYSTTMINTKAHQEVNPNIGIAYIYQPFFKWDSYHYLRIVQDGYNNDEGLPAFFPGFPLAVRGLGFIVKNYVFAGLVLNSIASYVCFVMFYLLALDFFKNKEKAWLSLMLFVFFPFSYFLSAFYSEALFCALAFSSMYFARKKKWLIAGVIGIPLTTMRLPALVFYCALIVEYMQQIKFSYKKIDRNIAFLILPSIGFVGYIFYLNRMYGNPLMFREAYKYAWTYQKFQPNILITVKDQIFLQLDYAKQALSKSLTVDKRSYFTDLLFFGSWLVIVASTVYSFIKKYPLSYVTIFLLSSILFVLNSNFVSINRYIIPIFPMFFIFGSLVHKHRLFSHLLVGSSAVLLGMMFSLFASGLWTG